MSYYHSNNLLSWSEPSKGVEHYYSAVGISKVNESSTIYML